ncbi:MAG TPA: (2Fe-2S) ferredoxin domain-containing protein [Firmicutes bacterium]|jgi:NADH:ubiquinone oxidoreductase subunit E|nr:(2Fe-2S) ferredoxin domain-containing protein [Bacillota bacterium]
MEIVICIGSGCHLKGSKEVQEKIRAFIEEKGLEKEVFLKASFCRGNCRNGVSMSIDGEEVLNVSPENIEKILLEYL